MFSCCANAILFIGSIVLCLYLWMRYHYGYWKRRNIYSPPAKLFVGHVGKDKDTHIGEHLVKLYNENKSRPFVGIFFLLRKTLLVNDLELIKNVVLKDFNYFQGHGFKANKEANPLAMHLFNLEGEEWKRIRVKLTPTFTSSKMKFMFETLLSCAEEMSKHIGELIETDNSIDVKEIVARFGTDVIASCAFGIESNSFKDPDAEFRQMGKAALEVDWFTEIFDLLALIAPNLMEKVQVSRFPDKVTKFFQRIVQQTIEYREANKIQRNDFLQLLIDMKNADENTGTHLSLAEITAQVFIFFLAGFETSSSTSTYALLELAKNPKIRDDLVAKVDEIMEECNGKVTYEALTKMTYLTQVVEETLRMYPPLPLIARSCTKDYNIPGTDAVIEQGTFVVIPILGIQRDPDIYPNPMQFDPERFSAENAQKRHQFAHIPFGEGPRICIGSRFGMMQVKLTLLTLLRNFHVELSNNTKLPIQYEAKTLLLQVKNGVYLKVTRRKIKSKFS